MEKNNQSQYITKAISFLICLLPILLITGPFLPDLAVCLSSILFLYLLLKNREIEFLYNKLNIFFLIFCTYLIIISLNADNIYVMDKGVVVGSGNHSNLIENSEIYKNFYNRQIKNN